MDCLADTVTIIRHFSGLGRIGKEAKLILEGVEKGDNHLFLSTISLVEILYLSEKKRIEIDLEGSLNTIRKSANYSIVDLTSSIVSLASSINFPDIFDRLIISTARYLGVPLITSDRAIRKARLVKTIWS